MRHTPVITPFTYLPPAIESRDATLVEALAQGLHLDGQFRIKVTQKNANEYGNENLHIQNFQVLHG